MASDLLLGFILGAALMGVVFPMKGVLFTILEQKKQIEFLRDGATERGNKYPDTGESGDTYNTETLAEKRP